MRVLVMILLMSPALMVQADQQKSDSQAQPATPCCLADGCPLATIEYCACGNCKEGCDCCQTDTCKCEGCTCAGCVAKGKKPDRHVALVNIAKLMKADCCQSGKCALAGSKCGCDQCQADCKCCSQAKCECKTCSCAKCKDPAVGAHAVASVSCGCGSCEAGCGCCTGDQCTCKGCTCSGCVSGKKMHTILVSKTSDACCKTGGACAHGHHGKDCKCDGSQSKPLPETPVLDN